MKAQEFATQWNKTHTMDVHFYLEENDGDIVGVRIRFPSTKYKITSIQWSALKNIVFSRSQQVMVVASSQIFSCNGAIDLMANPCYEGEKREDYDQLIAETLDYLARYVFPEYAV